MNREIVREIMTDAQAALNEVAKKYHLAAGNVRASFTDTSVKLTVEVSDVGAGGVVLSREALELQKYAEMFGLPKDAYGKEFVDAGHKYKLVGLASRRSRFPVIAERDDGKKYKLSVEHVKALLGVKS